MKLRPGLFQRRECVVPTARGWIALVLAGTGLALTFLFGVYPFLAVNDPRPGGVLVVEGWASDEAMRGVIDEFHRHPYDAIYATGSAIDESSPFAEYKTFGEYGAAVLIRLGCDPKVVRAVPSSKVVKDRTYSSAVALKRMLQASGTPVKSVNVYSMGVHSRRSRLLFQKAFGGETEIGIVAGEAGDFDPRRWWVSSAGFRNVTDEVIAYLYARFLFHPGAE